MKKLMFLFLSLFLVQASLQADNDKVIQFSQLPGQAQTFVKTHFADQAIALVKMETEFFDRSYEIIFSNGDKIEFNKNGQWKEIDCRYTVLPSAIIPKAIDAYVSKNYPEAKILKIEKENRGEIEVGLSNRLDLKFDANFNLIDIDN